MWHKVLGELRALGVTEFCASLSVPLAPGDGVRFERLGQKGSVDDVREVAKAVRAFSGPKAALALTMTPFSIANLDTILRVVEDAGIARVCFLFGSNALDVQQVRRAIDTIFARSESATEIFTAGNPMDRVYAWITLESRRDPLAYRARRYLEWTAPPVVPMVEIDEGGYVSISGTTLALGNVRERAISDIWLDSKNELLARLTERVANITGRCRGCRALVACGGGSAARTFAINGTIPSSDPGCYLTDSELGASFPSY